MNKLFSFVTGFFREGDQSPSSKRLSMIATIFAGLMLTFCSFFLSREIPSTALTLITTLIGATTATYSITRWKEGNKIDSNETKGSGKDEG